MYILATEIRLDSTFIKILSWIIFDIISITHLDFCHSMERYMQELCISKKWNNRYIELCIIQKVTDGITEDAETLVFIQ